MARNDPQASADANTAQGISGTSTANAGALYGTLAPQLEAEAANPQGFAPTDLAAMDTAAEQSAGGAAAGVTGEGGLRAARTRNSGGPDAATQEGARNASEIASKGALGTQIANARVKNQQQQAGIGGLESLYGTNMGAGVNALGEVAQNVNANTGAE